MRAVRRTNGKLPGGGARLRATIWLVGVLVLVVAGACAAEDTPGSGALGRGVYIAEGWQATRDVIGHQVHVLREKIPCETMSSRTTRIGPVSPERCSACHDKEARIEHAASHARERFGPEAKADCTTCHAFTPTSDALRVRRTPSSKRPTATGVTRSDRAIRPRSRSTATASVSSAIARTRTRSPRPLPAPTVTGTCRTTQGGSGQVGHARLHHVPRQAARARLRCPPDVRRLSLEGETNRRRGRALPRPRRVRGFPPPARAREGRGRILSRLPGTWWCSELRACVSTSNARAATRRTT